MAFRKSLAAYLQGSKHLGDVTIVTQHGTRSAALVPLELVTMARSADLEGMGLCSTQLDDRGEPMTRDQLAARLTSTTHTLGGPTVQLSAGEADAVGVLLAELGHRFATEALGDLATHWSTLLRHRAET